MGQHTQVFQVYIFAWWTYKKSLFYMQNMCSCAEIYQHLDFILWHRVSFIPPWMAKTFVINNFWRSHTNRLHVCDILPTFCHVLNFLYKYENFACMHRYGPHVCLVLLVFRRCSQNPWARNYGYCELCQLSPLQDQQMLFTADSSLLPCFFFFIIYT